MEEEGRRQTEKKTYRNCLEGELKCNFHIIPHGQSSHLITPSFLHITYAGKPVAASRKAGCFFKLKKFMSF